jgi:phosphatidylinositol 4-kinase
MKELTLLQYSPIHEFKSDKMDLALELTDDYAVRNEITGQLHATARNWLTLAISRSPIEVQSTLQVSRNKNCTG